MHTCCSLHLKDSSINEELEECLHSELEMYKLLCNTSHVRSVPLLKGNDAEKDGHARAWYRRKIGFIVFALLITLLLGSVFVGISLYHQNLPPNNLASFTCRLSSSNQTFTIDVEVDLIDGMDKDEAIKTATKVFDKISQISTQSSPTTFSSTAYVHEDGSWTVEFDVVYMDTSNFIPGHSGLNTRVSHVKLEMVINPFDQTVVYSF